MKKAEKELLKIQKKASLIDGQEIILAVKTKKGKILEKINKKKILEKIKALGIGEIKPSQIILEKPIKEIGEYPIKIKFPHNLEAEITLVLVKKDEIL